MSKLKRSSYPSTLLLGNFGTQNFGDELILETTLKKYSQIVVMTNDPQHSQFFCEQSFLTVPFPPTGLRSALHFLTSSNYRKTLKKWQTKITKCVFCGGGLFAISWRACFLWWLVFLWMKKLYPQSKIIFKNQGIDQNLGKISKMMIQFVFLRADEISVRDHQSADILSKLGINNIKLQSDAVFESIKKSIISPKTNKKKQILLCNTKFHQPLIVYKKLQQRYANYQLIFVPFEPSDYRTLPDQFTTIGKIILPKNKTELYDLFQSANLVIGQRFHFILLGYCLLGSAKTFVWNNPYSEKVQNFIEKHKISIKIL